MQLWDVGLTASKRYAENTVRAQEVLIEWKESSHFQMANCGGGKYLIVFAFVFFFFFK